MQASRFGIKYTGIALVTLIVFALVPISANYAKKQDGRFKEIAERAREKVDELGALIEDAIGATWPPTDEFPNSTIYESYIAASDDFEDGNYTDAMKAYRELYTMLNMYAEAEGLTFETGVGEEAQGLLVAIDRAYKRIDRIKDVNETYLNVLEKQWNDTINGWILSNLTAAEENLAEAAAAVEVPNLEWATANLTMANQHISDAFTALKKLAEWTSSWRIESFLMGIKKSVERTREMLELAIEQDIDLDGLLGDLESAEDDINNARNERAKRNTRSAIRYLQAARETLKGVHRRLAEQRKGAE